MSERNNDQPTRAERIGALLMRYRTVLISVSVVLVVGIIGAVAAAQILDARAERAAEASEAVQRTYQEWTNAGETERDELEVQLREQIETTLEEHTGSYGALRSQFILAELEWELENWSAARDEYLAVAERFDHNHLTAPALFSAAAASENLGEPDRAVELYQRIADGEGAPSVEEAHALFNLGRLAEARNDVDAALDFYNQLLDEHGDSNWTNLGRNRIIWLQSHGAGAES